MDLMRKWKWLKWIIAMWLTACVTVSLFGISLHLYSIWEERNFQAWLKNSKEKRLNEAYKEALENNKALYEKIIKDVLHNNALHFTATAYTSSAEECGNTKGITASGTKARKKKTVAVSRDFAHWIGKRIMVFDNEKIYGTFHVEDLTAKGAKRKIDIYFGDGSHKEAAIDFGTKLVKVVVL